jgi:hypothetical protein
VAQAPGVVFWFMTACGVASCCTVKVREPTAAPAVALTATPELELLALRAAKASGFIAASAAAVTARKVVLIVR